MVVSPDVSCKIQQVRDDVFVPLVCWLARQQVLRIALAWLFGAQLAGQEHHGRRIRV
jgi:hypothetical protein